MTPVPPPESPCVRVKMNYLQSDSFDAGSRFFLSYTGSAPSAANCATLAGDVEAAWVAHIQGIISNTYGLVEVDVQDIATSAGAFGNWTGNQTGGNAGSYLYAGAAINVEFDIARRYRGGKPRMFSPPASKAETSDPAHWSSTNVSNWTTDFAAFFSALEALTVGSMGTLQHVNLSYYSGFTNVTNSSGRTRAVPKYRTAAKVDPVTGYAVKAVIGSQRRRRIATTP